MQDLPPGGFDDGLGVTLVLVEGDLFGETADAKEVGAPARRASHLCGRHAACGRIGMVQGGGDRLHVPAQ